MEQKIYSKKIRFCDMWACAYILLIVMLSIFITEFSMPWFAVYLLLALPLFKSPEHFFCICFLLSTIPYYFLGASAHIYSIYTILLLVAVFNIIMQNKLCVVRKRNSIVLCAGLILITVVSFLKSKFDYANGMFQLIYMIAIPLFVCAFYRMDLDTIVRVLPQLASTMIVGYLLTVLGTGGSFTDGRLTISDSVNTNSFGMSCAQLATIMAISYYASKRRSKLQLGLCVLSAVLALLSGSRGALLAFVTATVLIVIIDAKRKQRLTRRIFGVLIGAGVALVGLSFLISASELDASRFSLEAILTLGESTRAVIYTSVIPYIINNSLWLWGYGPGHDCSRKIINQLTGMDFAHTHNTFVEAFGEIGIGGLILTVIYTLKAAVNINRVSRKNEKAYVLYGMLLCLLIHGMAESFFCRMSFWMILAICRSVADDNSDIKPASRIGE